MRMVGRVAGLTCALLALVASSCSSGDDAGAVVRISTTPTSQVNPQGPAATSIPPPEVIVSKTAITQAAAPLISVIGELSGGSITFINRTYKLTQGSQSMYAFIGADADDKPGTYPARIDFVLKNGSKGSTNVNITLGATRWTTDSITVPASLEALLDPAVSAPELAQLKQVYGGYTPQKLWNGPWLMPAAGAITTQFGEERSYNRGPITGHHGGTDIGAPMGAPVAATNSGKVVMARQLRVHGNMIVIDHGGGVYSGYAHLSTFAAVEGQQVNAGEIIGYVGSSGVSTAAHLHWEMSVGGVLVDALRFTNGDNGY
jgi:murein DD-endopeptidase MepM/ murein hydrolase activator NlpD